MTGEVDNRPQEATANEPDRPVQVAESVTVNPLVQEALATPGVDDASRFRMPDLRAPTDGPNGPAAATENTLPADRTQEATDVANLFAAVARGDKDQMVAIQSRLLGSNTRYEGTYMGQRFRLQREAYPNPRTHPTYSGAIYMRLGSGDSLVSRVNITRNQNRREVQSSGRIVSVSSNTGDSRNLAGATTDSSFINADDQQSINRRTNRSGFVPSIIASSQNTIKNLVDRARSANGADVRLGAGNNALEARVNLGSDGAVTSVAGRTRPEAQVAGRRPNERPTERPTERPNEAGPPQGQMETFLRENRDNAGRRLVAAISTGDAQAQAQAIRQLVQGGVRSLGFTRPGGGERQQELTFVPSQNGRRISVRLDGQQLGHISERGSFHPATLSRNLANLGLESAAPISIGIRGKPQRFELGSNPAVVVPAEQITPTPELRHRIENQTVTLPPEQRVEQPVLGPRVEGNDAQRRRLQEVGAELRTQGYEQVRQAFRQGDLILSIRPDGQIARATITGIDAEGRATVRDERNGQTVGIREWNANVNPERQNLTAMMRRMPPSPTDLPPVENSPAFRHGVLMTGEALAQQATSTRNADQFQALKRLLEPHGVNLSQPENSRHLADQIRNSMRFRPVEGDATRPGDIHILAPTGQATPTDTTAWDARNSPGMVLAITNQQGEIVRLSDGQRVDASQFVRFSHRAGRTEQSAAPLEAAVVYGRLFGRGQTETQSITDNNDPAAWENRLKQANSGFTSQGQIPYSQLASRLQSMDVGTTLLIRNERGRQTLAVVGEVQAAPNSTERRRVLYERTSDSQWRRIDDLAERPSGATVDVYKPNEAVRLSGTTQGDRTFDRVMERATEHGFNVSQLVGDPRARERFYSAIASGALPIDAIKRYISESGEIHNNFETRREQERTRQQLTGFHGVGAVLHKEGNELHVMDVFRNAPAERAVSVGTNQPFAIRAGDRITSINNTPVADRTIEQSVEALKGPAGTSVEVEIRRPKEGSPGEFETHRVRINRGPISAGPVMAEMDANGLVHVRINYGFGAGTAQEFEREIRRIQAEGGSRIRGYIIDMRNNPGGRLDPSLSILSALTPENSTILNIRSRVPGNPNNPQFVTHEIRNTAQGVVQVPRGQTGPSRVMAPRLGVNISNMPISVLVNEGSASASEIIAQALQDRGHPVYGARTFGKGTVQTYIETPEFGGVLRITTGQFLSPSQYRWTGDAITQRRGVVPDIAIRTPDRRYRTGSTQDSQFIEARRRMLLNLQNS